MVVPQHVCEIRLKKTATMHQSSYRPLLAARLPLLFFARWWNHRGVKTLQCGSDFGDGDAHRVFTAAQNRSVTAALSSATFQPFVSAFSLANLCSI